MKLTVYRNVYGVTPDGDWFQKIDGEWCETKKPHWYSEQKKKDNKKVVKLSELRMPPPSKKHKIRYIKVYRVIEKTVPDYEAEVLCRNGWQDYYPGTLRHFDEDDATQLQMG